MEAHGPPRLIDHVTVRLSADDKAWLDERAGELTRTLAPGSRRIGASDVLRMCLAEKRAREAEGDRHVQR